NLDRVRLAVEFPFTRPHARHEPPNSLCPGQQGTDRGGLRANANIRSAVGVVNESTAGSGHQLPFYTFRDGGYGVSDRLLAAAAGFVQVCTYTRNGVALRFSPAAPGGGCAQPGTVGAWLPPSHCWPERHRSDARAS